MSKPETTMLNSGLAYDTSVMKRVTIYAPGGATVCEDVLRYCVLQGGVLCLDFVNGSDYFSPMHYISFSVEVQA